MYVPLHIMVKLCWEGLFELFFVLIVEGMGLGDVFHVSQGQYILCSERFCMILSLELYSYREFVQILSNDIFCKNILDCLGQHCKSEFWCKDRSISHNP